MKETLTATYANPDAGTSVTDPNADIWLHMAGMEYDKQELYLSKEDIFNMTAMAIMGLSARMYPNPNCPVSIVFRDGVETFKINLEFYVYLSHEDLEYELTSNIDEEFGEISSPRKTRMNKSFSVVASGRDTINLDYRMASFRSSWETPAYYENGERTSYPSVELEGRTIKLDKDIFAVMRVNGEALLDRYDLDLFIPVSETHNISNISPVITARWFEDGEEQNTTLKIDIPDCVEDSMNVCTDGDNIDVIVLFGSDAGTRYAVYYNSCNGKFIHAEEM